MNDVISISLRWFGALSLLLFPAAPVAVALFRRRFTFSTTLAASVALAPFVVGVEWLLLSWIGLPFDVAVPIMAAASLVALFFLPLKSLRPEPFDRRSIGMALLAVVLLALPLVSVLTLVPEMRQYGWHNMMQLAACYQIPNLPRLPEEWDMAGVRLNYPWFGLIHLTAVASLLDASPTLVFPILNFIQLLTLIWIVRDIQLVFVETATKVTNLLTVTLYLLAVGFAGPIVSHLGIGHELRLDPPIAKFLYIDAMNPGLAVTALALLILVAYIRKPFRSFPFAAGVVFAAVGLTYPLLYPALAVILFAAFLVLLPSRAAFSFLAAAAPGFCFSALAVGFYLRILGSDGSSHLSIHPLLGIKEHLLYPPWQLGPWLALIALAGNEWRKSTEARVLLAASLILGAAYFVVRMPLAVEYKFIAAGIVCLAPLAASGLYQLSCRLAAGQALVLAALLVFSVYDAITMCRYHPPQSLRRAVPIQEGSFWIAAGDPPTGDWIRAIRERTRLDTVLLCGWSYAPVSVLAQRAMYLVADPPLSARPGYSMGTELMLIALKGYPPGEFSQRTQVVRMALDGRDALDFAKVTSRLMGLGRPVAVVLEPSNHYSRWLRSSRTAELLFDDGRTNVWLLAEKAVQ